MTYKARATATESGEAAAVLIEMSPTRKGAALMLSGLRGLIAGRERSQEESNAIVELEKVLVLTEDLNGTAELV